MEFVEHNPLEAGYDLSQFRPDVPETTGVVRAAFR